MPCYLVSTFNAMAPVYSPETQTRVAVRDSLASVGRISIRLAVHFLGYRLEVRRRATPLNGPGRSLAGGYRIWRNIRSQRVRVKKWVTTETTPSTRRPIPGFPL